MPRRQINPDRQHQPAARSTRCATPRRRRASRPDRVAYYAFDLLDVDGSCDPGNMRLLRRYSQEDVTKAPEMLKSRPADGFAIRGVRQSGKFKAVTNGFRPVDLLEQR